MKYGLCHLSIASLRNEASHRSELETQLLYGDLFEVLKSYKEWSYIRLACDNYEGWIDNKQYVALEEAEYNQLVHLPKERADDVLDYVTLANGQMQLVFMGSNVAVCSFLQHSFQGNSKKEIAATPAGLVSTANLYRNTSYLWGGKTHFGIDCSGFTQMVYAMNGIDIARNARDQAKMGEALSFIEEAAPGDLAFFDNEEGIITHVGIILKDNFIIHAHGKVRMDRLDQTGIFNSETNIYTHKLRVMRKILS